mmetsp:Transcript_14978/g.50246  ORF Transcript_14978/g.50246 Transcript_14978/m.50246 type:complete len:232 (-) Transcript_14978:468-1163(-)
MRGRRFSNHASSDAPRRSLKVLPHVRGRVLHGLPRRLWRHGCLVPRPAGFQGVLFNRADGGAPRALRAMGHVVGSGRRLPWRCAAERCSTEEMCSIRAESRTNSTAPFGLDPRRLHAPGLARLRRQLPPRRRRGRVARRPRARGAHEAGAEVSLSVLLIPDVLRSRQALRRLAAPLRDAVRRVAENDDARARGRRGSTAPMPRLGRGRAGVAGHERGGGVARGRGGGGRWV